MRASASISASGRSTARAIARAATGCFQPKAAIRAAQYSPPMASDLQITCFDIIYGDILRFARPISSQPACSSRLFHRPGRSLFSSEDRQLGTTSPVPGSRNSSKPVSIRGTQTFGVATRPLMQKGPQEARERLSLVGIEQGRIEARNDGEKRLRESRGPGLKHGPQEPLAIKLDLLQPGPNGSRVRVWRPVFSTPHFDDDDETP